LQKIILYFPLYVFIACYPKWETLDLFMQKAKGIFLKKDF